MILTLFIITLAAIILRINRGKADIIKKKNIAELKGKIFTPMQKEVDQVKEPVHDEKKRRALFKRISERKDNIFYNRILNTPKAEADDLTIIAGIDAWIVKKLNLLDIHTFLQISKFNKEDILAVNESVGFHSGRIEAEEWILQARDIVIISGNKAELFKRIRKRKWRIYNDSLIEYRRESDNFNRAYIP